MFNLKREAPLSIIEKPVFAKEEWFKAFYEGNSLIPLTDEGIDLCSIINVILDEKEMNWQDFARSELSPRQIKFLGDEMSVQHNNKGVAVSTEEKAETFNTPTRIIDSQRFKDLWETTKYRILRMLTQYIFDGARVAKNQAVQVVEIEKFFNNVRKNKKRIVQLRKALSTMIESLYGAPIMNLLREYREGFRINKPGEQRAKWGNFYKPKFQEILVADLEKTFENNLPKDIKNFVFRIGWTEPFD